MSLSRLLQSFAMFSLPLISKTVATTSLGDSFNLMFMPILYHKSTGITIHNPTFLAALYPYPFFSLIGHSGDRIDRGGGFFQFKNSIHLFEKKAEPKKIPRQFKIRPKKL